MTNFSAYSLLVTENCNLACKYCYEKNSTGHKNNNMTEDTAVHAVKFMFDQAMEAKSKEVSVSFFGGEPTLMPDIIDLVCKEGKKLSKKHKKRFMVSMITNATNMNEKLYNILSSHLDIWGSTQLSIDGPHEIQDQYRVTKKGSGSFDIIEKNIPYWKTLYGNQKLNIHGVLNPDSVGKLFESYMFFRRKWGIERLWFLPVKSDIWTQEHLQAYDDQLGKIYEYIMDISRKQKNTEEIKFYAPLDRALRDGKAGKPCGAGNNYCAITANGRIWPCHHFYFIDKKQEMLLGNIFDGIDKNKKRIWENYDSDDMVGCQDCDHNACYRCIAENYEKHGSPFVQIKDKHCDFMKIDLKYQKKIKSEVIEMGLMSKKNDNNTKGNDCVGQQRDCVGKEGDCPIVTSVEDCVFDQKGGHPPFDQVEDKGVLLGDFLNKKEKCQCADKPLDSFQSTNQTNTKEFLDDVIKLLVKYHNKL